MTTTTTTRINIPTDTELAELAKHLLFGDRLTIDNPDGSRWIVKRDIDLFTSADEYPDVYGKCAPVERCPDYHRDKTRPAGFTGAARKVWMERSDQYWWEPAFAGQQWDEVQHQWEYGFETVTVEFADGTDAYGAPIVRAWSGVGGIEWDTDATYLAEILAELVAEVSAELAEQH
jgi:hypothetical protein